MASVTLGSSFITGTVIMHNAVEFNFQYSHGQSQSRMVICESSTAYNNNSNNKQKQSTEVKSTVEEGGVQKILKNSSPRRNWWAPMFRFSSDGMWSRILPEGEKQTGGRVPVTTPAAGVTSIQGDCISLPDLIASSKQPPTSTPAGVTLIQRESTSLPDLIASSQPKHKRGKKQVIFDDEKARQLRKHLRVHENWHDGWVHSAIATRLAEPEDKVE